MIPIYIDLEFSHVSLILGTAQWRREIAERLATWKATWHTQITLEDRCRGSKLALEVISGLEAEKQKAEEERMARWASEDRRLQVVIAFGPVFWARVGPEIR